MATPAVDPASAPRSGPVHYAVSLHGRLGAGLLDAFNPLIATTESGRTVLRGPIEDQAALHGVLAKIQYLGLELDEVRRTTAPTVGTTHRTA